MAHDGRGVVHASFHVVGGQTSPEEHKDEIEWPYFTLGDTVTINANISSAFPGQVIYFFFVRPFLFFLS